MLPNEAVLGEALGVVSQTPAALAPAAEDVVAEVAQQAQKRVKELAAKIESLGKQLRDPAEGAEWTAKGEGLQMLPRSQWKRGMTEVEVPDWSRLDEDGQPIKMAVKLDGQKGFQENAKACFKQARKIARACERIGPMVEAAEADLERWRRHAGLAAGWRDEAGGASGLPEASARQVLELYGAMVAEGIIAPKPPPEAALLNLEEERRLAFRRKYGSDIDCYRTPGGHEVIAGRSSKTNEYVSLKLAKGDTMWFHTDRGIPGSHVLIKAPWDEISDEDIEFAARLAAYHSKGREDMHVPVMYCQGRDVRKKKGTRMGQVFTTGKTYHLVVQPGLPEEA